MKPTPSWSGPRVTRLRARAARLIAQREAEGNPIPCPFCPHPVTSTTPFDIDHATPRGEGGDVWNPNNLRIAHSSCNRSDGQRIQQARRARIRSWL